MKFPDKKTLDAIEKAHPLVRGELKIIYLEILTSLSGPAFCRFPYVLRTFQEQAEIYAQGRIKPGAIVTNSPAGLSIHNYGLAFDIVLLVDRDLNGSYETASWDTARDFDGDGISDWMEIVEIAKKRDWTWGGDWKSFKDLPHFEKTFGYKASDLLALYKSKKVDKDGYVLI
jgi:peptidoglycan L-alanyl-D-glutamate endopeptidase CwlK